MSLIVTSNLGKSYGPIDIFEGVTLTIPRRARAALVGPNGIGKTTLLRILVGLEEPTTGDVQRAKNLRLGYLPQEAELDSARTLWDEMVAVFADLMTMQAEMTELEHRMADPRQAQAALEQYGELQHRFEHRGGYSYEQRIRQVLSGLGFSTTDYDRPLRQLSGGQRTRALLGRLLLSDPDVLLLDEPTNHLDIAAVEWLEAYLKEWDGAVFLVSHDRYFMDQVVDTIWEMTPVIEMYRGNYSAYLTQREERYQRRLEEYEKQAEFIEREDDYIRRNMAGQNVRQAQGRLKRLTRMLEEARLAPPRPPRRLRLKLTAAARSGDLVVRTRSLQVGYHDEGRPLFRAPDIILRRGEVAAIIGPNGAGKTTFLKTLLEQTPPYRGEVLLGASLQIGYFAQAHEGLHDDLDLIAEIQTVQPEMRPAQVRDYLAKFLFTGDEVFKPVGVLSGGERGRLALAKLALQGANLLLLDEPTNHLDLPSQEVLQSILSDYEGTILLVSHDRYLIDALASQIWEVDPQKAELTVFEGSYSQYKQAQAAALEAQKAQAAAQVSRRKEEARREQKTPSPESRKRKRLQRLQELEVLITAAEADLERLSRLLENPPADPGKVQRLGQEYVRAQNRLEELLGEWTTLMQGETI